MTLMSIHAERLLSLIDSPTYKARTLQQLAQELEIPPDEMAAVAQEVQRRIDVGQFLRAGNGHIRGVRRGHVVGVYKGHRRGFGFCIPLDTSREDLFIPPSSQASAITGDRVLVKAVKKGKRQGKMRFEGHVIEIIERGRHQFVGVLQKRGSEWWVQPEGHTFPGLIAVPDASAKGARDDSAVVVEVVRFPDDQRNAQGVIVEVLGTVGDPGVDVLSIIRQHEIPDVFPDACTAEARQAAARFAEADVGQRTDLRDVVIITIDPDDARDFDDAISVQRLEGRWELGVHIADVSFFVTPGSALDRSAAERGNSVYFPGHVVPMLPEILSNGVCSLQEGIDRFAKSVFITLDDNGEVLDARFANSVIRSTKRLTYGEATGILEGKTGGYAAEILQLLQDMDRLARIIQRRRHDAGMLVLNLPDVELNLDDGGNLVSVSPEDTSFSHTIIEMFMVEANEASARLLTAQEFPHLRRVHAEPDPAALSALGEFLGIIGRPRPGGVDRNALHTLLAEVADTPDAYVVNYAALRAQQPASYMPRHLGHFALASEAYCHFTSPIRRYPDLLIHRAIDRYLADEGPDRSLDLPTIGEHCSATERTAEEAERELKLIKVLQYLAQRTGEIYDGTISAVMEFGLFVRLEPFLIDGLLRLEELPPPPWEADRQSYCVINSRTGRRMTVGDAVRVKIARVDLAARQLDLALERQISARKGKGRPPRKRGQRDRQRHRRRRR
jgi:ribonuclease R